MENYDVELKWNDRNNVGVEIIDKAHKELFSVVMRMKRLIGLDDQEKTVYACSEMIKFFKTYTMKHFQEEEAYMKSIDYEDFDRHKARHDELRALLPKIEEILDASNYSSENVQHFLGICIGWLTGHIMTEDKLIGAKHSDDLRDLSRLEGMALLSSTISSVVNEMFGINPVFKGEHEKITKLLDDCVVCELTYSDEDDEELEIVLMLEEQLVLDTVGSMAGITFEQVDAIVLSATTELAKILMQRVKVMFKKYGKNYSFKSEKIASVKEMKKHFKKYQPMYSLLFNTEKGNFLFCIGHH